MKLKIVDLHVEIDNNEILKGVNLELDLGKVHVLMGPNGCGKSTLSYVLMGHPKYKITSGNIYLDGEDITNLPPNERAKKGLFLSFQYPAEITGVTLTNFLRTAREMVTGKRLSVLDFHSLLKEKMSELKMDSSFAKRYINEGFSGGEKKRAEILQLSILEPKFAILDETDSGLDTDAIKIVADGINRFVGKSGILLITHYNRFLDYILPDQVSIMINGRIVKTGGKELAKEVESDGFAKYLEVSA